MEFDPALKVVQLDRLLSKNPVRLWSTGRYVIRVRLCGGERGRRAILTATKCAPSHRSQKRKCWRYLPGRAQSRSRAFPAPPPRFRRLTERTSSRREEWVSACRGLLLPSVSASADHRGPKLTADSRSLYEVLLCCSIDSVWGTGTHTGPGTS